MNNDEFDPVLKNAINDLKNSPPRDPQTAARGRVNFLAKAASFRQTVSRQTDLRHNRWTNTIFSLFQRKERLPVLNILFAVIIALTVFLGGTGGTVYAAQDSLPDQILYPLKTWSEDAILSLTGPSQTRLNYALDFSDRRVKEMASLHAAGKPIPDAVETRLQNELDLALELTAGMGDSQAIQQMSRIRQRAENQSQIMMNLMSGTPGSAEPLLLMAHARLREQVQLAAMGETDLGGFRMRVRQRFHGQGGSGEPAPENGNGSQDPGSINPTGMPGPSGNGNGYGPGPGMNQPTMTPGQYYQGSQMPVQTPQSGGGSGKMP
jgi:hypothetical protein